MDIGEVEGETEDSDDQIDELRGTRKSRRDERSTHQRGSRKQSWKASSSGRHEKQTTNKITRIIRRRRRTKVCKKCGDKGHPTRLLSKEDVCGDPDHATQAVDEEGNSDEESSEEGDVCGVKWGCELNGAGDEDDDILGMRCESTKQSKWERLAAVVDSDAAANVLRAGV